MELDTRPGHECFRLPASKIEALEEELRAFYEDHKGKEFCDPLRLATLVGRCGFMSQIVEGGRQHLRRLYNTLRYAVIDWTSGEVLRCWGSEPVPLSATLWADLDWWLLNARYANHTPMKLGDKYVDLFLDGGTDASDWGCGGEIDIDGDTEEFRVEWTSYEAEKHEINWRELAGMLILFERMGERMRNKRVRLRVDNSSAMYAIRRGSSKKQGMHDGPAEAAVGAASPFQLLRGARPRAWCGAPPLR